MKYRDAVLAYQKVVGDTDTITFDLDIVDPVSAIELEVECTNGATSNVDNFISDIVTNIQLVDGAEVFASLSMQQLEALHFFKQYRSPAIFPSEWGGANQRHNAMLMFGRMLYDPQLVFIPGSYKNPQLKISFNKSAIRAAGATGFASGNNILLTAVAKVIEEGASPQGFLSPKIINSFVTTASGDVRVDLPTDYPIKMLLMQAYKQGSDVDEILTNLRITADTDKYVPIDRKIKQLQSWVLGEFGTFELRHDIFRADAQTVRLIVNKDPSCVAVFGGSVTPHYYYINTQGSGQLLTSLFTSAAAAESTAQKWVVQEVGHAPYSIVPIVFGTGDDPGTWLDPRPYKKLEAILTQGVANANVSIVAEQYRY